MPDTDVIVIETSPTVIELVSENPTIVEINESGGKVDSVNGKQGAVVLSAEDINFLIGTAGQALGGHRVVKITPTGFDYADNQNITDMPSVIGITLGAASAGSEVKVAIAGKIVEPSWSFTVGQNIYLSTNELLTQTPPTSGFLFSLGKAISPTSILISFSTPLLLI